MISFEKELKKVKEIINGTIDIHHSGIEGVLFTIKRFEKIYRGSFGFWNYSTEMIKEGIVIENPSSEIIGFRFSFTLNSTIKWKLLKQRQSELMERFGCLKCEIDTTLKSMEIDLIFCSYFPANIKCFVSDTISLVWMAEKYLEGDITYRDLWNIPLDREVVCPQ